MQCGGQSVPTTRSKLALKGSCGMPAMAEGPEGAQGLKWGFRIKGHFQICVMCFGILGCTFATKWFQDTVTRK